MKFRSFLKSTLTMLFTASLVVTGGCVREAVPGPDKQGEAMVTGALTGAASGAITGFQVGAGTGPGAFVGAGLGAVAGSVQGAVLDSLEDKRVIQEQSLEHEREISEVQGLLAAHYRKRNELHPARDIYPADFFFSGDEVRLCSRSETLVSEIAKMNADRFPWSRFIVASYVKATNKESPYAFYLASSRAKAITNQLVRSGMEPRRIVSRAIVVQAPVVIDPLDSPDRYNQAVEFIPVDR